jgi:hypothetical protein
MTAIESLFFGLLLFPYSLWEVIEALVGMLRIRAIRKDGVRIPSGPDPVTRKIP